MPSSTPVASDSSQVFTRSLMIRRCGGAPCPRKRLPPSCQQPQFRLFWRPEKDARGQASLPYWNEGPTKQSIQNFAREVTTANALGNPASFQAGRFAVKKACNARSTSSMLQPSFFQSRTKTLNCNRSSGVAADPSEWPPPGTSTILAT